MKKGLLIYNRVDADKNRWFIDEFLKQAETFSIQLQFLCTDELVIGYEKQGLFFEYQQKRFFQIDFVINRSRESLIGLHFESMGARVFNPSYVTEICNHKAKTHQIINRLGIPSVLTIFGNKINFSIENLSLQAPFILKSVNGHGGSEVYLIAKTQDLPEALHLFSSDDFILQEICGTPGIDIRVFYLGGRVVGAVKRFSTVQFKANISLGGQSEAYELNEKERMMVETIGKSLPFDFVGIDFLVDSQNQLIFNEIEDVVGTRTLYQHYPIDVVHHYLAYIIQKI